MSGPGERTRWSSGLVGFYVGCAAVALGAAIAAGGWLWFHSLGGLVAGIAMAAAGIVMGLRCLKSARLE